ncbi:MAG TPA: ArsB/NhaD family transporter [Oscillatoriaceae cyanobacterium]
MLALALLFVVWRPGGMPEAVAPTIAALLLLLFGIEPFGAVWRILALTGDALATLIGLMVLSQVLDRAGFFRWCAWRVAALSRHHGGRAWWGLMLLACLVTAVLANDGAMLMLVPLYAEMLKAARLERAQLLAFLMPLGFLIDIASTPLVTSNLTNIMLADAAHLSFWGYAQILAPTSAVLIGSSLLVLWGVYRRAVPSDLVLGDAPPELDRVVFVAGWAAIAALVVGVSVAHLFGWPIGAVVDAVALALLLLALGAGHLAPSELPRMAPWSIVVFAVALFTIVDAVARTGGSALLASGLHDVPSAHVPLVLGAVLGVAANLLNNLPALFWGLLSLPPAHWRPEAIACTLVAVNVASKLLPYGSLSTLLWLKLLADKGIRIGWGEYLRTSLWLMPPIVVLGVWAALHG